MWNNERSQRKLHKEGKQTMWEKEPERKTGKEIWCLKPIVFHYSRTKSIATHWELQILVIVWIVNACSKQQAIVV